MTAVAVFFGGLDSTVLLASLVNAGDKIVALPVDYRKRHRKEFDYAERIANRFGIA